MIKIRTHQDLVNEITKEFYKDENVLALILYGSVSRHEESANSDIDLLAIVNENHLQKRHEVRHGITVEFVEMHLKFLQNFIVENEGYRAKRRSDLTEIYNDLLDIDDVIAFNYVASLLITNAIPMLLENNNLWHRTRKKMTNYLQSQCYDGYKYIETLLNPVYSLYEKRDAAKKLTEYVLKPHGGILKGDAIIFRKNNI